jgi:RNA polymerase sigma-70 factor (ECF subfamily)
MIAAFKGCEAFAQDRKGFAGQAAWHSRLATIAGSQGCLDEAPESASTGGRQSVGEHRQRRAKVGLREELGLCAPQLYRFACALVSGRAGPCSHAASLVRAALGSVNGRTSALWLTKDQLNMRLYSALIERNRDWLVSGRKGSGGREASRNVHIAARDGGAKAPVLAPAQDKLAAALLDLKLEEREALLLVALEGFSYARAARILKVPQSVLAGRLVRARAALGQTLPMENYVRSAKPRPAYLRLVK